MQEVFDLVLQAILMFTKVGEPAKIILGSGEAQEFIFLKVSKCCSCSRSENHMEVSSRSVDDSTLDVSSITEAAVAMYLPREKLTTTNATRGIEYVSSITGMSQVPKAMELTERVADERAM